MGGPFLDEKFELSVYLWPWATDAWSVSNDQAPLTPHPAPALLDREYSRACWNTYRRDVLRQFYCAGGSRGQKCKHLPFLERSGLILHSLLLNIARVPSETNSPLGPRTQRLSVTGLSKLGVVSVFSACSTPGLMIILFGKAFSNSA